MASRNRVEWKRLGAPARREVFRLANTGERHPDPQVAEAAAIWAHSPRWDRLSNRIPGWVLPSVGALFGVVCLLLQMPLLCIAAGLVIVFGLLGWVSTAGARALRRVYEQPGAATHPAARAH
ncbi:hypothetical protein GCM10023087_19600 [Microbacterium rhizosphaerae]